MTYDESREGEIPIRGQADNEPPPKTVIIPVRTHVPILAQVLGMDEDWGNCMAGPKPRNRHHIAGAELWLFNDTGVLVRGFNTYTLDSPTSLVISASGDVLSATYLELTSRPASHAERDLWREALSRENDYRQAMATVTEHLQFIAAAIGTLSGAPGIDSLDSPAGATTEPPSD